MRIASNQALNVRGQLTTGATNDDSENSLQVACVLSSSVPLRTTHVKVFGRYAVAFSSKEIRQRKVVA